MLRYALLSMLLEFIVIHSAAFMGAVALDGKSTRMSKAGHVLGLGLMYTAFVGAFALAFGDWWPLVAFWSLTVNRLTGVLLHTAPEGQEREQLMSGWAISAVLYILWIFATLFFPLPRLGLTAEVVAEASLPGEGIWVESPQKVIAAGAGYFLSQAYVELKDALPRHRKSDRSVVARG